METLDSFTHCRLFYWQLCRTFALLQNTPRRYSEKGESRKQLSVKIKCKKTSVSILFYYQFISPNGLCKLSIIFFVHVRIHVFSFLRKVLLISMPHIPHGLPPFLSDYSLVVFVSMQYLTLTIQAAFTGCLLQSLVRIVLLSMSPFVFFLCFFLEFFEVI